MRESWSFPAMEQPADASRHLNGYRIYLRIQLLALLCEAPETRDSEGGMGFCLAGLRYMVKVWEHGKILNRPVRHVGRTRSGKNRIRRCNFSGTNFNEGLENFVELWTKGMDSWVDRCVEPIS